MSEILSRIVEGYTAPARSTRRILDTGIGMDAILLMVLFSYLVTAIITTAFSGLPDGMSFGFHVRGIILQFVTFFVYSTLIYHIGRMAGGTGDRLQTYAALAWHALVTSFLTPFMLGLGGAMPDAGITPENQAEVMADLQGPLLLAMFGGIISLWLMASYVRELHGFQSTWSVLGALVIGAIGMGLFVMIIGGGLAGG